MPPKGAAKSQKGQEKAAIKAKQKVAEDKTFGLKNKNKSKQVQKMVQAVQKNAVQQPKRGAGPTAAEAKKAKKEAEEARQRELNMLFRISPDDKKKAEAEKAAKEAADKEAAASDAYAHLKDGEEEYRWTAEDFEPIETAETRIEEQLQKELEELRERLEKQGGGTKVNPESFAVWKEKQRKLAAEELKKSKEKMAKTGKWTGRALFEHNKDLFVDDEDADEEIEREVIPDEEEAAGGAIDASLFDGDDLAVEDADEDEDEDEDADE